MSLFIILYQHFIFFLALSLSLFLSFSFALSSIRKSGTWVTCYIFLPSNDVPVAYIICAALDVLRQGVVYGEAIWIFTCNRKVICIVSMFLPIFTQF